MKPVSRLPLALDKHFAERAANVGLGGPPLSDALSLWRLERLRETVRHAARHSLFYRGRLDEALRLSGRRADTAEAAQTLTSAILNSLPHTYGPDLAAGSDTFLAVGHSRTAGVISLPTSGTTGPGKRIYCTESDLSHTRDFFAWGMQLLPAEALAGSTALLMSGNRPGSVGDLLIGALAKIGASCSALGFVEDLDATLETLAGLQPTCLVGVPGQIFRLARRAESRGLRPNLRAVLCSGDTLSPPVRAGIAEALGCPVFAHYGLTETGLGGAVECPEHAGCHMREADMVFEILDASGAPVSKGDWGELCLTTLTRTAMPLLRYHTGDEARILPESCACSSIFGLLRVRGRLDDAVPLPHGGRLDIEDLETALFAPPDALDTPGASAAPLVEDVAFSLHAGDPPRLVVSIQPAPPASADAPALLPTAPPAHLSTHLETRLCRLFADLPGVRVIRSGEPVPACGLCIEIEWNTSQTFRPAPKRRIRRSG